MNEPHLSDDRLIELCVSGGAVPAERAHLTACTRCELRRGSVVQILQELDEAATVEADAAFPPDKLARQESRILQRIDQDGRPGRVIAFPASDAPSRPLRSRPHVRWAAAVAAAAFLVGVVTGLVAHDIPSRAERSTSQFVASDAEATTLRAVSTTFSEDEFLGQVEQAAGRSGPAALRPLDAMTPRAWDVR